jgi:hypothetical protein
MARQQAKTTLDTDGRQRRSLAPARTPTHDLKGRGNAPHAKDSGAVVGDIRTRVEKLAYELYLQRGRQDGYDTQDLLEAEQLALASTTTAGSERLSTSSTT